MFYFTQKVIRLERDQVLSIWEVADTIHYNFFKLKLPNLKKKAYLCRWDVILDTPVLVLPRKADSSQVLVAHLGRMSLTNQQPQAQPSSPSGWLDSSADASEHYDIEIRDMNVYTLDVQKHLTELVSFTKFILC